MPGVHGRLGGIQRVGALLGQRGKRTLEFLGRGCFCGQQQRQAQRLGRLPERRRIQTAGRIQGDGHARDSGNGLFEQLQALALDLAAGEYRQPGDVPARMGQTGDEPLGDGIGRPRNDDRNDPRGLHGSANGGGSRGHNDIDRELDQFRRHGAEAVAVACRPALFQNDGVAFAIAKLA